MTTFRHVYLMCTTALPLLFFSCILQCTTSVNGRFPLPNPIESPHLKNQSLVDCLSTHDKTLTIKATPNKPTCKDTVVVKATFTPNTDLLMISCYGKVYLNGVLLIANESPNICNEKKIRLTCPMLKGVLQKYQLKFHLPCALSAGYYKAIGYCRDQDDVTVGCLEWTGFWEP